MKILIAEDDLTARTILSATLKKWKYDPVVVKDGQAAWDILSQPDAPRLVILDWMMPGLDGLEVIRRLRASSTEPPTYVILLTSKDEKGDIIAGLETGANDYVRKPFDPDELYARIRVGQRTVELQTSLYETQQILAHQATHDFLTGILNRSAILEQLSREIARIERSQASMAVPSSARGCAIGFFDIDRFKSINDQLGHQAGDKVLKGIVNIIARQLRPYDSFGRLGGDEFLVVAPEIEHEKSKSFFERLLIAVTTEKILIGSHEFSVSVSLGVASASMPGDLDKLLESADAAMYRAKRSGGNRVAYAWNED